MPPTTTYCTRCGGLAGALCITNHQADLRPIPPRPRMTARDEEPHGRIIPRAFQEAAPQSQPAHSQAQAQHHVERQDAPASFIPGGSPQAQTEFNLPYRLACPSPSITAGSSQIQNEFNLPYRPAFPSPSSSHPVPEDALPATTGPQENNRILEIISNGILSQELTTVEAIIASAKEKLQYPTPIEALLAQDAWRDVYSILYEVYTMQDGACFTLYEWVDELLGVISSGNLPGDEQSLWDAVDRILALIARINETNPFVRRMNREYSSHMGAKQRALRAYRERTRR
ncbi:hypothetical protein BDV18DRAFT_158232 [Aspergillus unguis]